MENVKKAIPFFLKDNDGRVRLLKSIDQGILQTSALSWPQKVSLLNSSDPKVRPLARSLLHGSQLKSDEIWNQYEPCLSRKGDLDKGAEVFGLQCGICHQLGGQHGVAFGPDLAPVKNRNKASLLLDILQPNRAIADGYELWNLELKAGAPLVGVITEESASTITIRNAIGEDNTVQRAEIAALKTSELSAMSEGLHEQISVEEMADLLAFLKGR